MRSVLRDILGSFQAEDKPVTISTVGNRVIRGKVVDMGIDYVTLDASTMPRSFTSVALFHIETLCEDVRGGK